jgi:hypothetical protein
VGIDFAHVVRATTKLAVTLTGERMAETPRRATPKESQSRRRETDREKPAGDKRPTRREDARGISQDDRLIGAERFPRKGDDE